MSDSSELGSNSSQSSPLFFSLSSYTRFLYQDRNPTMSSNNPEHGSNSSKPSSSSAKLFFSLKSYSRFRRSESLQTSSSSSDSIPHDSILYSQTSSGDSISYSRREITSALQNSLPKLALDNDRKRSGVLRRGVTITTGSTDSRKVASLLDASLGDLHRLLPVYDSTATGVPSTGTTGIVLSLPPIAITDPILSWVWSYIATIQKGGAASASDRTEAANSLACLALDDDRNKKIIMEEGGLPPLLSLLCVASNLSCIFIMLMNQTFTGNFQKIVCL